MPSFISSSKTPIVVAGVVLAAYATAIALLRPAVTYFPDQDGHNIARAERYLLYADKPGAVILGSSLSVRLSDDWLPAGVFNLALGGMSARTGLSIAKAKGASPPVYLIETNVLLRPSNERFLQRLPGRMQLAVGRWLPALRYEYRPINVLLSLRMARARALNRTSARAESCASAREIQARDERPDPRVKKRIAALADEVAERFSDRGLKRAVGSLADELRPLVASGVKIAFFELPVHPAVARTQNYAAVRAAIADQFPDSPFLRISGAGLNTVDGSHLAPLSAVVATCELFERLAAIGWITAPIESPNRRGELPSEPDADVPARGVGAD